MGFLARIFLGDGTFKPGMRAELVSEGIIVLEENLRGSIRYRRFKAPGRRFHGKIVPVRMALAVTERRLVAYSSSGRVKLMNSPWDSPHLRAVTVTAEGDDTASFHVDYRKLDKPRISGVITIRAKTPDASAVVRHVTTRLPA